MTTSVTEENLLIPALRNSGLFSQLAVVVKLTVMHVTSHYLLINLGVLSITYSVLRTQYYVLSITYLVLRTYDNINNVSIYSKQCCKKLPYITDS